MPTVNIKQFIQNFECIPLICSLLLVDEFNPLSASVALI